MSASIRTQSENYMAFMQRLDPEHTMNDLEQRAKNAHRHAMDAIAAGDEDKLERAVGRLFMRWGQWDALVPAAWPMAQVWKTRHAQLWSLLEALGEGDAGTLWEALLERAYEYAALDGGLAGEAAKVEAAWLMHEWRTSTTPHPSPPSAPSVGAR